MSLNLVPWHEDTYWEVRVSSGSVNAYTGISFDKTEQGFRLSLNKDYTPARLLASKTGLDGSHFTYITTGLNRVRQELEEAGYEP